MLGPMTTRTFPEHLRELRGDRPLVDVVYDLRQVLPENMWISQSTLSRYELDPDAEKKMSPVLVTALAKVYGASVSELSELHAAAARTVRDLLVNDLRWMSAAERTAA